jgi:hypothetical protein
LWRVNKFRVRAPSRYTEECGEQAGFLLAKTTGPAEAGSVLRPRFLFTSVDHMPRPRKDDTRSHQINIRFTAREFARVHHHAGLLGKTPADFGRGVMLRRPRRRNGKAPVLIAIDERTLRRWHETGSSLNGVAHHFNATGEIPEMQLERLLRALRRLVGTSFPGALVADSGRASYALAPMLRYHLRKTCTNLVQIADRFESLGHLPPPPLLNLIRRFRVILNGDSPPHGP